MRRVTGNAQGDRKAYSDRDASLVRCPSRERGVRLGENASLRPRAGQAMRAPRNDSKVLMVYDSCGPCSVRQLVLRTAKVAVKAGRVKSAIMDERWDMIQQRMLEQ